MNLYTLLQSLRLSDRDVVVTRAFCIRECPERRIFEALTRLTDEMHRKHIAGLPPTPELDAVRVLLGEVLRP